MKHFADRSEMPCEFSELAVIYELLDSEHIGLLCLVVVLTELQSS